MSRKCFRKDIFGGKECFTSPKVDFGGKATPGHDMFPSGGLNANFTINPNDLEKYGTIVLYSVSVEIANVNEQDRTIEDAEQISKIDEYSKTYQLALQPAFR